MTTRLVAAVVGIWLALWPAVAAADPPGPTDYDSVVVAVDPPAPAIHPSIVGGDSFFALAVDPGTTVDVVGYRGEPYLRFLASGEVQENRSSVTYHQSRSRYGSITPDGIDADTPPTWRTVARDGRYAWHDHRAHWMSPVAPLGAEPGDVILEAQLPLVVDGRDTAVTVVSRWQASPSPVAVWIGVGVGLAAALVLAVRRRSPGIGAVVVGLAALAALVIGVWQFRSVPRETGPPVTLIALPGVALLSAVAALVVRRARPFAWAATLLAGVELALWAWPRRDGLGAAILPTDAPYWLDRATTAAVLVAAVAAVAVAVRGLVVARD